MTLQLSNRDRKLAPKKGGGYCWGCDASIVPKYATCKVCGSVQGPKTRRTRLKKDTNA